MVEPGSHREPVQRHPRLLSAPIGNLPHIYAGTDRIHSHVVNSQEKFIREGKLADTHPTLVDFHPDLMVN